MITVCQLIPIVSLNDKLSFSCLSSFNFYATHYCWIGNYSTSLLGKKYSQFSATNWCRLSQSNILIEEVIKFNMTFVCQLFFSLSGTDEYHIFGFVGQLLCLHSCWSGKRCTVFHRKKHYRHLPK